MLSFFMETEASQTELCFSSFDKCSVFPRY